MLFTTNQNLPVATKLQQQDFNYAPLDRSGFTIIEWGGSEISTIEISKN